MTELFVEFQEFRKILCVCPCCGELVKVSDLKLKVKGAAVKTWLDEYEKEEQVIIKNEEKFNGIEEKIREKWKEKGREQAEKVFNNAILPSFKALKLDPFDIKPILNPIDFVVFKGMNKKEVISDILFLSKVHSSPSLEITRKQVEKAILNNKYEWQVARIDYDGHITFE